MDVRLKFEHVETGAGDRPGLQRMHQRLLVDNRTARCIHEDRRRLHQRQLRRSDQMTRRGHQRNVQADEIGLAENALLRYELRAKLAFLLRLQPNLVVIQDAHIEAVAAPRHGAADAAHAEDSDGGVVHIVPEEQVHLPLAKLSVADEFVCCRNVPRRRDQQSKSEVGGRIGEHIGRIRTHHTVSRRGGKVDVVVPDGHIRHDLQLRRRREQLIIDFVLQQADQALLAFDPLAQLLGGQWPVLIVLLYVEVLLQHLDTFVRNPSCDENFQPLRHKRNIVDDILPRMQQQVTSTPTPLRIFETINAYQQSAAIKAAIELDVFTHIAGGAAAADQIAGRAKASPRGMRILCDYLVIIGLLTKTGDQYRLAPDSALFLDRNSRAYMGDAIKFLLSPMLTDGFRDLTSAVRKGGTAASAEGTIAPEHPIWVEFARSMAPLQAMAADGLTEIVGAVGPAAKVLDIACGHGLFGIAIARRNSSVEVIAQDWAGVLELAKENARSAGVGGRYRTLPGSAFDVDFGGGYDLVLLTNFLHHFDPPTCERLLRKVRAALKPGGRTATLEFVPNEDRVTPETAAAFSLMMLGSTPSGDAYTFSEFDRMFRNAGFSRNELHAVPPGVQQAVISHT